MEEPDKSSYRVIPCNMRNVISTFKSIIQQRMGAVWQAYLVAVLDKHDNSGPGY